MLASFSKEARKHDYSKENALVGISIGQAYHEASIFRDVAILVTKTSFNRRILMIADTLQAYNLILKGVCATLDEARKEARKHGDQFLGNKEIAEAVTSYDQIIRWNEFLNDPRYVSEKAFIDDLYEKDEKFQRAVNKVAGGFLATHYQQLSQQDGFDSSNIQPYLDLCREYIKEELAVMMLWTKYPNNFPFHFIVYPKPKHTAAQYIYDNYVKKQQPTLLQDLPYTYTKPKGKKTEVPNDSVEKTAPKQQKSLSFATLITSRDDSPMFAQPTSPTSGENTDDEVDESLDEIHALQSRLLTYKKAYRDAKRKFGKNSDETQHAREDLSIMHAVLKRASGSISNGFDSGSSDEKLSNSSDETSVIGPNKLK